MLKMYCSNYAKINKPDTESKTDLSRFPGHSTSPNSLQKAILIAFAGAIQACLISFDEMDCLRDRKCGKAKISSSDIQGEHLNSVRCLTAII